jgi:hypothetical protein
MAELAPMAPASSSWPPSQALTLTIASRLTASHARAMLAREKEHQLFAQAPGIHQHVEGQDQDGQDAEEPAADVRHSARDFPDRVASRPRGGLHRLTHREVFLQQALLDQELLAALEHLRSLLPQGLPLLHERRKDEEQDEREGAQNRDVEDEDGEPSRQALGDREKARPLDHADDGAEAHCEEHADVNDDQRVADDVRRPEQGGDRRRHRDAVEDQRADFFGAARRATRLLRVVHPSTSLGQDGPRRERKSRVKSPTRS